MDYEEAKGTIMVLGNMSYCKWLKVLNQLT